MRIEIKTKEPIKDNDIKALYLIKYAMLISSERMKLANLQFALKDYIVIPKS